jgi:uncharacterized glyoxalase superfamily metalloenzyme YdcJ
MNHTIAALNRAPFRSFTLFLALRLIHKPTLNGKVSGKTPAAGRCLLVLVLKHNFIISDH